MRGLDWNAVRARYEPLLARVTDRSELDDLLAQMIAPLDMLHSQVRGGDYRVDAETAGAGDAGRALSAKPTTACASSASTAPTPSCPASVAR